jgi:hypothetical protein
MMVMASRVGESSSTNPRGSFESVLRALSPDQRFAAEKAFSSVLIDSVVEAVANALGRNILELLVSKGLLDNSNNAKEFDRTLQSLFGNGSSVIERIVVKDLYRKLSIPYDSTARFDYEKSLETAIAVCFVENRLK